MSLEYVSDVRRIGQDLYKTKASGRMFGVYSVVCYFVRHFE